MATYPLIISLSGKIGTGKTTTARVLKTLLAETNRPIVQMSFSLVLKWEVQTAYCLSYFDLFSQEGKRGRVNISSLWRADLISPKWKDNVSCREIMQYYGTELTRKKDPDYWVKKLDEQIKAMFDNSLRIVIIDDVRFPNELEYVLKHGFCYRLEPFQHWKADPRGQGHESEIALDDCLDRFTAVYHPDFARPDVTARKIMADLKERKAIARRRYVIG